MELTAPHQISTDPLARSLWSLDLRCGALDQLMVSGTVGTADGTLSRVLGTELADAQGADPFLTAREAAPRPSAASSASAKGNRELQGLKTMAEEISYEI